MVFSLEESQPSTVAKLKVVGVGGAGGNAVNRMVQSGLQGVEFIAVNTDAMALEHSRASVKIQIGTQLTHGLGAGAQPQVGMMSMQEDRERVKERLAGADMVFIAAGMGGGTGTGAAPVVADLAREMGILTVAVVTRPFLWEGPIREKNSQAGLEGLRRVADTVIVVPNQKLLSVVEKKTPMREAFKIADEILCSATRGISEIILKPGEIQVDFADVRTIMSHGGDALMGTGRGSGENKAQVAADRAIHSPLLDNVSIAGATGVLVNITGGEDLCLSEVDEAMNFIYESVGNSANTNIIFGTVINPELGDEIAITVIATGFGNSAGFKPQSRPAYEPFRRSTPETRPAAVQEHHVSDFVEKPEPKAKSMEEPATGKVAFGARPVPSRPTYVAPRAEESRSVFQDPADAAGRKNPLAGLFGTPQRGRYSESSPDIDYETPAFLRNPAD
jgi:cell division protein FtsZ